MNNIDLFHWLYDIWERCQHLLPIDSLKEYRSKYTRLTLDIDLDLNEVIICIYIECVIKRLIFYTDLLEKCSKEIDKT